MWLVTTEGFEAAQAIWFAREGFWKDFQGNIATEASVLGPIHLTHAARAEQR